MVNLRLISTSLQCKHYKSGARREWLLFRDEELVKITEHRVATFSHDLIPDYLRTRPDPELENRWAVNNMLC